MHTTGGAADAGQPEGYRRTTSPTDGVDYGRINTLLASINEKLTTDVYGNFYIRGSQTVRDGRHSQLREIVELKHLLEANKALMERKPTLSARANLIEGKKGGKVKSESQILGLADRIDAAEAHLEQSEADHRALLKRGQAENEALCEKIQFENHALKDKVQALENDAERQDRDLWDLRQEILRVKQRTEKLEAEEKVPVERVQWPVTAKESDGVEGNKALHKMPSKDHEQHEKKILPAKRALRPETTRTIKLNDPANDNDAAVIEQREEHIEVVTHHAQHLNSFLEAGDAVLLHKRPGQDIRQLHIVARPGDYNEARLAAKTLFRWMNVGDRMRIVKAAHTTLVEMEFLFTIPDMWVGCAGWIDGAWAAYEVPCDEEYEAACDRANGLRPESLCDRSEWEQW